MKLDTLYYYLAIYKERYHVSVNFFSIFLLVTFLPDLVGLPAGLVTNGLWAFKGLLAILVILAYSQKVYLLTKFEKLYAFVVFIYLINIIADVFLEIDLNGYAKVIDLVSFVVSLIVAFSFRYDVLISSDYSYYFLLISLAIGLLVAYFVAYPSPPPFVGRYDANSTVNTINYGQMGCAMCIISIYGFVEKKFSYSKLIFPLLFVLGIISIMKAGSRSPILVLAIVCAFFIFSRLGTFKGVILFGIVSVAVWVLFGFLAKFADQMDSGLLLRLANTVEERDTSGRDKIYANAIQIIKEHPIFGSYYFVKSGVARGSYPHNFFLEAFMTTGLVGGIPFVIMIFIALFKSYKFLKMKHASSWMILMFLQLLVYGMFSSNLFSSQDFWALSLFVLGITQNDLEEECS